MADHLRKQLRDAFAAAVTGLTTTGSRVYTGRTSALAADASPSLLIDMGAEDIVPEGILAGRQRTTQRTLEILARAAVKQNTGYLDTLDTIALEVEHAIAANQSLGGLSKSVQLAAIDEPDLEGQAEKNIAVMALHFNVTYYATLAAPQTAL